MQHKIILRPRRRTNMPLRPIIRDGVCENRAIAVESTRGNGVACDVEALHHKVSKFGFEEVMGKTYFLTAYERLCPKSGRYRLSLEFNLLLSGTLGGVEETRERTTCRDGSVYRVV